MIWRRILVGLLFKSFETSGAFWKQNASNDNNINLKKNKCKRKRLHSMLGEIEGNENDRTCKVISKTIIQQGWNVQAMIVRTSKSKRKIQIMLLLKWCLESLGQPDIEEYEISDWNKLANQLTLKLTCLKIKE